MRRAAGSDPQRTSYRLLHTDQGEEAALGWFQQQWRGHRVLSAMDLCRAIIDGCDLDVALVRVGELAANPPSDWSRSEWLSIVAVANLRATSDPHWFKVKALAYETGTDRTDVTGALWAKGSLRYPHPRARHAGVARGSR